MSKRGKKMGLGDFLGTSAAVASQPVKGVVLPSGPDPNRDPDERRGPGGRRYDDDYDGPGARSDGTDNWRRGPVGGGFGGADDRRGGGGYDYERGGMAPEEGTWRSRGPPRIGGSGYGDRDGGMRSGGYDDRRGGGGYDRRDSGGRDMGYSDSPASSAERPRLQLERRKAPPPMPPMAEKESIAPTPTPKSRPSGPKSNPFGDAQAVDTTRRDREIEAKVEAARHLRIDENIRTGRTKDEVTSDTSAAVDSAPADSVDDGEKEVSADSVDNDGVAELPSHGDSHGEDEPMVASPDAVESASGVTASKTEEHVKPVGRWAALRRDRTDDRTSSPASSFPRRDRDDERRGSGLSNAFDGRRDERPGFGRRNDGIGGSFGSRTDREPLQPPAPPAGNAFAKRFGSNFDRDSDRAYPRPGAAGGGGAFDRRDDDRRGGMGGGGFDRREDDRRGGMGAGFGGGMGLERRDDERRTSGGGRFSRGDDNARRSVDSRPSPPSRGSYESGTASAIDEARVPLKNMSVTDKPPVGKTLASASATGKPAEPVVEVKTEPVSVVESAGRKSKSAPSKGLNSEPEPEPEPEPKEDPAEVAREAAAEAMASNKRGEELRDFVLAQEKRTTAGALLRCALAGNKTPQDFKWAAEEEFGAALTALSEGDTQQQVGMVYAVQASCHELGFPKDSSGAIVQSIFMKMYQSDLCEEEAFIEWKDDVDNPEPGRMKAVMQTTPWFVWLESVDEEEEEEEEEEEDA